VLEILKKLRRLATICATLILALTFIQSTTAQKPNDIQTFFSKNYPGISIEVNATRETVPGENMTVNIWVNCTAVGVHVDQLAFKVHGFRYGREKTLLNSSCVIENTSLIFSDTSQYSYMVPMPDDVWDVTQAELLLKYVIMDSAQEYNPSFSFTVVRNVYLEELENKFESLNSTFEQLNQTFLECFEMNFSAESLASLNQTYWELQQNSTSLQENLSGLENARQAIIVLAITTVFFIATTIYMVMRKPKQYL
jgi:hypothetical protein